MEAVVFKAILIYIAIGQLIDVICTQFIIANKIDTKKLTPIRMNVILSLLWPLCLLLAIVQFLKDLYRNE